MSSTQVCGLAFEVEACALGEAAEVPEIARRIPRQARSAATVAAILEAASQILDAGGPARFSTNRIAERAGVSIGTLYQYYPNKNAILAAIARDRIAAVRDEVAQGVEQLPDGGRIRPIIRALIRAFDGPRATRLALFDALFNELSDEERIRYVAFLVDDIGERIGQGRNLSRETIFVLTRSAMGVLRAAIVHPNADLDWGRLEDELVCLLESYAASLAKRRERLPGTAIE